MKSRSFYSVAAVLAACTLFSAPSAEAASTFNLSYTFGQVAGLTASSKAILVIDTAGDGFTGVSDTDALSDSNIANFSFTSGTTAGDDYVLGVFNAFDYDTGTGGFQGAFEATSSYTTATSYAGKQLAVYFFESGSNAAGESYGFFRTSTKDSDGGTIAYVVPNDGNTDSILSASTSIGGSGTTFNGTPTSSGSIDAVPEPSRMILAGLGLMTMLMRRRRK